ncbi:MAG: hypothetical protein ACLP6G_12635 [Terriglobales bacterium]
MRTDRNLWLAMAAVMLCFMPYALGQGQVNINLTGAGNNVMDGVYVGPYNATVNGASTQIICDDFVDESYLGESWTANVTTLSNLNGTKWGGMASATTLYDEAAWLATQMLSPTYSGNTTQVGYLAYALWAVFAPSAVESWLGANSAAWQAVQGWLSSAAAQQFTPGEFANFFIYTPNLNYPITCNGGSCPITPPQEFFGFLSAPEGGSTLMYVLFTLLTCLGAIWFRSRRQTTARVTAD